MKIFPDVNQLNPQVRLPLSLCSLVLEELCSLFAYLKKKDTAHRWQRPRFQSAFVVLCPGSYPSDAVSLRRRNV
jgi:hypothetical protein